MKLQGAAVVHTSPALRSRELTRLRRAYEAGSLLALFEALGFFLADDGQAEAHDVPAWVLSACSEWIGRWLIPRQAVRGRTANPHAAAIANLVHVTRWDMVEAIRRHQAEHAELRQGLQELLTQGRITRREMESDLRGSRDFGRSWEDAYKAASRELASSIAFGTPAAIKKSYLFMRGQTTALIPLPDTERRLTRIAQSLSKEPQSAD